MSAEADALILRNVIMPTLAILDAEYAHRIGHPLWCCPLCGGLNSSESGYAGDGWCQHDRCVDRRGMLRTMPAWEPLPEIWAARITHAFRPEVYA